MRAEKESYKLTRTTTEGCAPVEPPGRQQTAASKLDAECKKLGIDYDVADAPGSIRASDHQQHQRSEIEEKIGMFETSPRVNTPPRWMLDSGIATPVPASQQRLPVLPGAFPQAGLDRRQSEVSVSMYTYHNQSDTLNAHTEDNNEIPNLETQNAGLVEANPVKESEAIPPEDLELAQPMDTQIELEHNQGRQRKTIQSLRVYLLGAAFLLLVVVGLVIFLVARSTDDGENSREVANNTNPTPVPTLEPLFALLPSSTREIIQLDTDVTLPQSKAYDWMQNDPNITFYPQERLLQRFAMVTFYYATDGPNWYQQGGGTVTRDIPGSGVPGGGPGSSGPGGGPPQAGGGAAPPPGGPPPGGPGPGSVSRQINITSEQWLDFDTHECDWFSTFPGGNSCENGTYTVLELDQNGLTGHLPPELGLASTLERITLHGNAIGGAIPSEIGLLSSLDTIILNSNQFTGAIPPEIGQLSDALLRFSVLGNGLEGSIPEEFWSLTNLLDFKGGGNSFTGTIPKNIGDLFPKLLQFRVERNGLTGELPASFAKCTDLEQLKVEENQLTGTIPTALGQLSNAVTMGLRGNNMRGTIPSELGMLPNISRIKLGEMIGLSGSVPTELGLLQDTLTLLAIDGTSITGTIPPSLCQIKADFDCSSALCGCDCACST